MKRLSLVIVFLLGTIGSAFAACTGPAVMHDFPGTSFNMSLATVPDGNCGSNIALPTWAGGTLGAMANYGTSPGAVLVPGVNAFVTNTLTVASHAVTVASGGVASGGVASGAFASGALASGSVASGAMVDLGSQADSAAAGDTSTASLIALLKRTNQNLTTVNTTASAATPAGTNSIGTIGADPSKGAATPASTFLALPATTTTQIVALSGATKIYVTSYRLLAGGTVNVTFKYGTGSNCGTGTTTLEGPWPLTAQAGIASGAGVGAVLVVPSGQALCITTDASVTGGVGLSYQQL